MNENQNEMTNEQLDELEQRKLSGDHQFISLNREVAKELFTLARQGLQLREEIQTRHSETHYENRVREVATLTALQSKSAAQLLQLTAELEALRKELSSIKARNVINAIKRICAICGHTDTEDGCAHCIRKEVASLQRKLEEVKGSNEALRFIVGEKTELLSRSETFEKLYRLTVVGYFETDL